MELYTIIETLLGGGLLATVIGFITMRSSMLKARAEADSAKAEAQKAKAEVEATATCDSLQRTAELYEELFYEAGATADSLRQALEQQQQQTAIRRSNTVRPMIICFILGLVVGAVLTYFIYRKYGNRWN